MNQFINYLMGRPIRIAEMIVVDKKYEKPKPKTRKKKVKQ